MQKSLVQEFEPATTMICTNSVAIRKESGRYIHCAEGSLLVSSWTIRLGLGMRDSICRLVISSRGICDSI